MANAQTVPEPAASEPAATVSPSPGSADFQSGGDGSPAVPYLAAGDIVTDDVRAIRRKAADDLAGALAELLGLDFAVARERLGDFVRRIRLQAGAPDGLPALVALDKYALAAFFADSHEEMIAVLMTSGLLKPPQPAA
jgi:hypothetical protein